MAKMTKTQLANALREEVMNFIAQKLEERGEQVLTIAGNAIGFPTLDAEGNETAVKITFAIPRGSRLDGEPYDIFAEAEGHKIHLQEVEEKQKQKEKEKKIAAEKREKKRQEKIAEKEEAERRKKEKAERKEEEEL